MVYLPRLGDALICFPNTTQQISNLTSQVLRRPPVPHAVTMKLQHMSEAIWIGVRHVEEIHLGFTAGLQRRFHGLGYVLLDGGDRQDQRLEWIRGVKIPIYAI